MKIFKNVSYREAASLVISCNMVGFFQGASEAGPRALGNRSLLFSPILRSGKTYFNRIKGREDWRPFAGTILADHSEQWFELSKLYNSSSQFMSYAVPIKEKYRNSLPTIIQDDGTCRIQTVSEKENYHFYSLIKEFFFSTGIPIIGNTSFNVAGDPLVETLDDAIKTLEKSQLEFLYLPEVKEMIYVENN